MEVRGEAMGESVGQGSAGKPPGAVVSHWEGYGVTSPFVGSGFWV